LIDVDFTTIDSIKSGISQICLDLGIKMGKIMPDLRTALTGGVPGPDLMTVISILSPDDVRSRIGRMCKKIPA
jgi:glutamyl/glutaminyl-tRNA synthetase